MPNVFESLKDISKNNSCFKSQENFVESGYYALRFLLRDLKITHSNRTVATSIFSCGSVVKSIIDEGWDIVFLDLENSSSFWAEYKIDVLKSVDAVILVHLYGDIHPNFKHIEESCASLGVPLIHDCAQTSFMLKNDLNSNFPSFYSFNIGKYFTAAGGAFIKNSKQVKFKNSFLFTIITNFKAFILVRSRMYHSKINFRVSNIVLYYLNKIFRNSIFFSDNKFFTVTKYQLKIINSCLNKVLKNENLRIENYNKISLSVKSNSKFILLNNTKIPANKVVFIVNDGPQKLHDILAKNNIHFYRLFMSIQSKAKMVNFNQIAHKIFEISCESSIPKNEIMNICNILKCY